ncbi:NACHT domain-containing protein [Streptomyces sp. NPDC020917]|uniref:NACHT domain-containing protein n=1 Tax=Streptomyces sp. NPDC020917 TaxID=3365102 RepID=UPI0037B2BC6F
MNSGGGRRRLLSGVVCAAAVVASVVYAILQAWHGGLGPADLVTVLGFPLAVVGAVGMLAGFRKPRDGTEATLALEQAGTLARLVAESEGRVLTQLLGRDTARINLRYGLVPGPGRAAQAPAAGLTVPDPVTGLPEIAAYYLSTRPARLVITGAPGAGKTVLALQLLLDLIAERDDADPVPVRFSLAQWDTDVPLRKVLVRRLIDTFNLPRAVATNLVAHGLVLPVLDGLDEMDPPLSNGDPDPVAPRARAALDRLSAYQDAGAAAPLVLTCRSAHYDALAAEDLLLDAARITIAPVGHTSAVAYLTARARDLPRWQPLLNHLAANPTSMHAQLLSTPWRLGLTATVYHRTGDPTELLAHPAPADLDNHLLARYITAVAFAAADANPHRYAPRQIHRWLHQLAAHLAPTPWVPARTDIAIDRLWLMAGPRRVRVTDALLAGAIVLLPLPLAWATPSPAVFAWCGAGMALVLACAHGMVKQPTAGRLNLHPLATPAGRARLTLNLAVWVVLGPVLGLVLGLARGLQIGLAAGLGIGLAIGLAAGLAIGLVADQSSAATPGTIIGEDARLGVLVGLEAMLVGGLVAGLLFGVVGGLMGGLVAGLVGGLATGPQPSSASWRYLVFLLCTRRRVPFRLARFLDWGCRAGLMRYSGSAYQFRHRELQLWLAAHPDPVI